MNKVLFKIAGDMSKYSCGEICKNSSTDKVEKLIFKKEKY